MLADEKKTNFAEIERKVGLSNGQIRRWDKVSPKVENLKKVADYLDVSTDYLLGRTDWKSYDEKLTRKNFESIQQAEHNMTVEDALKSVMSYDGKELTDNDREILKGIIEGYLNSKDK